MSHTNPAAIRARHNLDDAKQEEMEVRLKKHHATAQDVVNNKNRHQPERFDLSRVRTWKPNPEGTILCYIRNGRTCVYTFQDELNAARSTLCHVRTNVKTAPLHRTTGCTIENCLLCG